MKRFCHALALAALLALQPASAPGAPGGTEDLKASYQKARSATLSSSLKAYQKKLHGLHRSFKLGLRREDAKACQKEITRVGVDLKQLEAGETVVTARPSGGKIPAVIKDAFKGYEQKRDLTLKAIEQKYEDDLRALQKQLMAADDLEGAMLALKELKTLRGDLAAAAATGAGHKPTLRPENVPEDAIPFEGHFYKVLDGVLTWHDARIACEERGGGLVVIDTPEENDFVREIAGKRDLWIGLTKKRAYDWAWIDDKLAGFTAWAGGATPDKNAVPDFAYHYGEQPGSWWMRDESPGSISGFICEWDPAGNEHLLKVDLAREIKVSSDQLKALVIIEGDKGRGSGWIGKYKGKFFVYTNLHVIGGGQDRITLQTSGDGRELPVGKIFGAKGYDLAIIAIPEQEHFLEPLEDTALDTYAQIGDTIHCPGNALGGGVVREKQGKLMGIGPQTVEVDAPFVQGNSGGPIIHKDGKVIGLCTYVKTTSYGLHFNTLGGIGQYRYFGFRVDNVRDKDWYPINWETFSEQGKEFHRIEERTEAFEELFKTHAASPTSDPAIAAAIADYERAASKDPAKDREAWARLITKLQQLAMEDINAYQFDAGVYDWFLTRGRQQRDHRKQLRDALGKYSHMLYAARKGGFGRRGSGDGGGEVD